MQERLWQSFVRCGLLAATVVGLTALSASANSDSEGSLWVGESRGSFRVASDSGAIGEEQTLAKGAGTIAVNDLNGDLWVYSDRQLHQYSSSGAPQGAFPLPSPIPSAEPRDMVVDGTSGNLWVLIGKQLHRFDLVGGLQSTATLSTSSVSMTLDRKRSILWVAQHSKLTTYDLDGRKVADVTLAASDFGDEKSCAGQYNNVESSATRGKPQARCIYDVAYDPVLDRVWVSLTDRVQRYAVDGQLEADLVGDSKASIDPDGAGGLWYMRAKQLGRIDPDGNRQPEVQPFLGANPQIVSMAADPVSTSIWLANLRTLKQFDVTGAALQELQPTFADGGARNILRLALFSQADIVAPTLRITAPSNGAILRANPTVALAYSDAGSGINAGLTRFEVNGVAAAANCSAAPDGASCVLSDSLPQGQIDLAAYVSDNANNESEPAIVRFTFDSVSPSIKITQPQDNAVTNTSSFTITGSLSEPGAVTVNGAPATASSGNGFSFQAQLVEGENSFSIVAMDSAGNTATASITVFLDTMAPPPPTVGQITVSDADDGMVQVTGAAGAAEPNSRVAVRNRRTGQTVFATVAADGSFSVQIAANADDALEISTVDTAGNQSEVKDLPRATPGGPPPDPMAVATPLSKTSITPFHESVSFLYSGANSIQTGVAPGTISPIRAAVIRGRVLDRAGNPIPSVVIRIKDHAELGQTLTRADGMFDIAVNGGGILTLDYTKDGLLPVQRQIEAPWRDFATLQDVVMIGLDPVVTTIDLGSSQPMQIARGSPASDADGQRRATLLFPQATSAQMRMPDGTTRPLAQINVRATEYTVGSTGPAAMPAPLPPASGYTYAVELSADEAIAVGASSVEFSQPVLLHVDNFLDFPVGVVVPAGYYDPRSSGWIASENGRVIEVLAVENGRAVLDVTGSSQPSNPEQLGALGITDAELIALGATYTAGQGLWRVAIPHFSPWDLNWGFGPPIDAEYPDQPEPKTDEDQDDCDEECGSIIYSQDQALGETLSLSGVPFALHYVSDRVLGRATSRSINISVTGPSVPSSVLRIDVTVEIAGRTFRRTFPRQTNLQHKILWDGKDAYGRSVLGTQLAHVQIDYVYRALFYSSRLEGEYAFGKFGYSNAALQVNRSTSEATLDQRFFVPVLAADSRSRGFGGWTPSILHEYDFAGRVLNLGTGGTLSAINEGLGPVTSTFAEDIPAGGFNRAAPVDIATSPDGGVYAAFGTARQVRKVFPDGSSVAIAGTGSGTGPLGDGGPATEARLLQPVGVALGPDGAIYIADITGNQVRRVNSSGVIETFAGNGLDGAAGDGGKASQARVGQPTSVAVTRDGTVYVAQPSDNCVRRIDTNGLISTAAGQCGAPGGFAGDGGPAKDARLDYPDGITAGPDGSLFIAEFANRIRRVLPDGRITTYAGNGLAANGNPALRGDGGFATNARVDAPLGLSVSSDGTLYFTEPDSALVRAVSSDGHIRTIAGTGVTGFAGDAGPSGGARFNYPLGIAHAPDGGLYIADSGNSRIRKIAAQLPGFKLEETALVTDDGSLAHRFSISGKHLATVDTKTGHPLATFIYRQDGYLESVSDGDGNVTRFERDSLGNIQAVVGEDGHRTELALDANGYLASVANPASETYRMAYTPDGLLTRLEHPRAHASNFIYDLEGRLQRDENAAGGFWQLSRSRLENGFVTDMVSAEGRQRSFKVVTTPAGDQQRVNTAPDGTQTVEVRAPSSANLSRTMSDGTVMQSTQGPDPRFGMQAPVLFSSKTVVPSGLIKNLSISRSASLSDAGNPLSLVEMDETLRLNGRTFQLSYSSADRAYMFTSAAGRQRRTIVDLLSRPTLQRVPGFADVIYAYDSRGRIDSVSQGSGADMRSAQFNYGDDGFLASVTDALGRVSAYDYDMVGRLTKQILPGGREITFAYDANGNLQSLTPPGRTAHGFEYTPVDLEQKYGPPRLGTADPSTAFDYNLDKDLTRVTRPDGKIVSLDYDFGGRLSRIDVPEGSYTHSYHPLSGQLASVTAPDGTSLSYSYDGFLLRSESLSGAVSGVVSFDYDSDFRVRSVDVNGQAISLAYDPDSLLVSAGSETLSRHPQHGLIAGTTLGNVSTTHSYNLFAEPAADSASVSGASIYSAGYTRDKLGRIVTKTETIQGQGHTYGYSYDPTGRLDTVIRDGILMADYAYDLNGNRLSRNGTQGQYDAQDRLLSYGSTSYSYNAHGDLETRTENGATTRYTYDVRGNLRSVSLPGDVTLEYLTDGRSRRVGKRVNGSLAQGFLYQNQLEPIAELNSTGQIISRFVYASKSHVPDYLIKDGQTYRIVSDHLGSPRLVINTADGSVAQRMDYDEFGNVTNDTNPGFQPFGFAGGIYDPHTRLTRFGARDYDAETGRWTAKDPSRFKGGDTNLYRYTFSDPINFRDTSGKSSIALGAGYGLIIGGPGGAFTGAVLGGLALIAGAIVYNEATSDASSSPPGPSADDITNGIANDLPTIGETGKVIEKQGQGGEAACDAGFDSYPGEEQGDTGPGDPVRVKKLPDGRYINKHPSSDRGGAPTLEVPAPGSRQRIKIRY